MRVCVCVRCMCVAGRCMALQIFSSQNAFRPIPGDFSPPPLFLLAPVLYFLFRFHRTISVSAAVSQLLRSG
uniref:Putative secreted protein n=1 Tax=Anopheles triannulatus TaxID=58253 RepID=A0A2M4B5N4_9DIPT